ncbi:universal stress protein [Halovenus sp. WSH3]|uniref:Universal stress protein n=1 Tax=Halovenus carboxidivorans TaxID=2692199 RepID=A0A6B0T4U0_9EURY|nr:universal stress protein [Halovenus carboxidivorans]MXR51196.1 universal stress protein [Halovenus carboxidivorans]
MYDNILLPTDGSEGMAAVVDHASELAAIHDATLHALYVANTASMSDLPMESSWEGVSSALRKQGERAVESVEETVDDQPVETHISDGSPSKEIVSYAEENDCDVIAMGTHGRSGVDRLLLGSVAERVVRSSPVPVLTIRVGDADS